MKKINKKILYAVVTVVAIVTLLLLTSLCIIKFSNKVYSKVYLNDEEVSGMTPETLVLHVKELQDNLKDVSINIIQDGEKIFTVTPDMIEYEIDVNSTVKQILGFGRSSNFGKNLIDILNAKNTPKKYNTNIKYDEEKLDILLKNIDLTIKNRVVYDSYYVDMTNNKLKLKKGKSGFEIDYSKTKESILNSLFTLKNSDLNLYLIEKKSDCLDLNRIYNECNKEAKDAYIDDSKSPVIFVKHEQGISVEKDKIKSAIEDLQNLETDRILEVELQIVEPEVKLADIKYDMYNDKLASFTTYFAGNKANRSKNIEISSSYLNDVIIMPGEIFSFNNTVGDITAEKGYLNAATFSGGKVVDGIGGGVCQVSSTLYNTVLLGNLEIVERYAHSLPVSYVLPSRDATIYVGVLDFKFKNTRNYPIKLITSYSKTGSLTISIYGTKEEVEYDIEIQSNVLDEINFKTDYIQDSNLERGKEEIISNGVNGFSSNAYVIKKLNGKEVEKKLLSNDVYASVNKIVKIGTK